jgi:hypothetical protein
MFRPTKIGESMRIEEVPRIGLRVGKLIYVNRPSPSTTDSPTQAPRNATWRLAIDKANRASDPSILLPLVYAAETALFLRSQELGDRPDTIEEREEIRAAINDLLAIKIHKLKWPDFTRPHLAVVN